MHSGTAEGLVTELGRSIGIAGLKLDDSGLCELVVDGRWDISIAHHASHNALVLHCTVWAADLVQQMERSTLLMMLKANFLGSGTGGAVIAIGGDGQAGLQLALPLSATPAPDLPQAVARLLHEAEAWSARLSPGGATTGASPSKPRQPRFKVMA